MKEEIQVYVKNVYGKEMVYPACSKAKYFTDLMGRKTFTKQDIRLIGLIGFFVRTVNMHDVEKESNVNAWE